jgi:hypothetical protein
VGEEVQRRTLRAQHRRGGSAHGEQHVARPHPVAIADRRGRVGAQPEQLEDDLGDGQAGHHPLLPRDEPARGHLAGREDRLARHVDVAVLGERDPDEVFHSLWIQAGLAQPPRRLESHYVLLTFVVPGVDQAGW